VYPVTISIPRDVLGVLPGLDPAGLIDILWAHTVPEDRLEHIAQHLSEDTVDIMFFVKSEAPERAHEAAIRICQSALSTSRPLANWRLVADDQGHINIRIS
jgi:hypothetical protein